MSARTAITLSMICLPITLACGGALGGGGSAKAQALCDHLAKELDCPCVTVGAGNSLVVNGLEFKVDQVAEWEGKDSLPEISNMDERANLKKVNKNMLALEVSFTNTQPVKADVDSVHYLMTGDGDKAFNQPYNGKVYRKDKDDWIDFWDDDTLGPSKTRQAVLLFPVGKSAVENSLLVIRKNEKRPDPKDPRGRMKTFTDELFVVDLGPPT